MGCLHSHCFSPLLQISQWLTSKSMDLSMAYRPFNPLATSGLSDTISHDSHVLSAPATLHPHFSLDTCSFPRAFAQEECSSAWKSSLLPTGHYLRDFFVLSSNVSSERPSFAMLSQTASYPTPGFIFYSLTLIYFS